jgi:nucleoside-diphosphate-sugar epimerase
MNDIRGKRIVLIGGAGFIGHHLALKLKGMGAEVEIIDGLQVNNLYAFRRAQDEIVNQELYLRIINERLKLLRDNEVPLHMQDARDYHALNNLLSHIQPQVIVQLAAVAHAGKSNKDPYSTFDHSLRTLENALDWARGNAEHFVYLSSSMVYGDFEAGSVTEESVCNPLGIYGALKFAGEKMVIAYNQVFDLPYTILRPSALYGERCVSRRVGQIFIENAIQGMDITVDGDGSDRLDFTYIKDFVAGVTKVIEHPGSRNEIFNLTYGSSRSIMEMSEILKQHFPDVTIKNSPRDKLMPERGTLSVDKAKEKIGYDPQFPLDKGFVDYIKWYKEFNWSSDAAATAKQ